MRKQAIKDVKDRFRTTVLVVEHKVREVFQVANEVIGLRRGEVVYVGKPESFTDAKLKDLFL